MTNINFSRTMYWFIYGEESKYEKILAIYETLENRKKNYSKDLTTYPLLSWRNMPIPEQTLLKIYASHLEWQNIDLICPIEQIERTKLFF